MIEQTQVNISRRGKSNAARLCQYSSELQTEPTSYPKSNYDDVNLILAITHPLATGRDV